ncbi:MAG: AgmX/PglI C-terminal domain-containing protein [Myxococcaceae bacterium]
MKQGAHLSQEKLEQLASQPPRSATGDDAAHLGGCAECRQAVVSARARQKLMKGLTPYTLSDHGFRRVEARLEEAVREGLPSSAPWWRWLGLGGALVAAAVAVLIVSRPATDDGAVVKLPAPKVELARATFRPLTVIRAQKAQARAGEAWRELHPGDVLQSGDALSADLVALSDERGEWAFEAQGSSSLGGVATLTVGAGQVTVKVKSTEKLDVLAATRTVFASEAVFQVSRAAAEVALVVSQGEVEVVDSVSGQRRVVKAPAAVRWSDGSALTEGRTEAPAELHVPAVPPPPWAVLDASGLPAGAQLSLDGLSLGTSPLAELVTAGHRKLMVTVPGQPARESWIDLIGGKRFEAKYEEKVDERPDPDAAALARVMSELKRHTPKLQACYEKWLKANPTASGEPVLELTVTAKGVVKRAAVAKGSGINASSAECLVRTAKSLSLPPLGVEADLELPLVLRPHN